MLVFLFGAIPSAVLTYLAGLLIYSSFAGNVASWAVAWGIAGIVGSVPFWALSFGPTIGRLSVPTRVGYAGLLILGILSAAPLFFGNWVFTAIVCPPIITGVWIVSVILSSIEKGPNQPVQRNASTGSVSSFESARRG